MLDLYPNSQRHSHYLALLFVLSISLIGLPSASIPYRRFEMVNALEISNADSSSHNLRVSIPDHRLAERLGSYDVLLICIVLGASHRFLLIVHCMSDSPYHPWGQMIAVFTALHFALRGAQDISLSSELMNVPGVAGVPLGFQFVGAAQSRRCGAEDGARPLL